MIYVQNIVLSMEEVMEDFLFVFQNYVWVPIISTLIGTLFGYLLPKIIKKAQQIINRNVDEISIAGDWNSFFNEEKTLQTEKVHIDQIGREISGTMKMNGREYFFTGQFKNRILLGTYESKNVRKDERGTIVLRYINEKILSGYCTFIYKNQQVYNSSYVLTLESNHKVDRGTYQFCNACVGKFDCCCNCENIDMPILMPFEIDAISRITKKNSSNFAEKKSNNLYQMKRKDSKPSGPCCFFINNKCSIYDNRPLDCRLFPFDFKEINGEYWVIYYSNVCKAIPTNGEEIDMCSHNIRPILDIVLPYMSECSDPIFCEKLKNQEFIKLFPINKILDGKN